MPFLRVNGWDVPIIRADRTADEIGERGQAIDGSMLIDRRGLKRRWPMVTKHVSELVADALEGVLRGDGHNWSFDGDFYSGKGMGVASSSVGSLRLGTAADGSPVVDIGGAGESKFGSYGLTVEPACAANLFAQNKRNGSEDGTTTGFATVGSGSISSSTTQKWQGNRSVQCVTVGSGDGMQTTTETASPSTTYSLSMHVWCASAISMRLALSANVSGDIRSFDFTTVANSWTRVSCTGITGGSDATIKAVLIQFTGATTFYVDGLQIEAGSVPTTWLDTGSRAAGNLIYPTTALASYRDITVAFWAKSPPTNMAAARSFISIVSSTTCLRIRREASANNVSFGTSINGGTSFDSITPGGAPWGYGLWHHIAAVFRNSPESGESKKTLYIDGASVGTSNPSGQLDFSSVTAFRVGHNSTELIGADPGDFGREASTVMDELIVVPWAAPTAQIEAWYNIGKAIPAIPAFYVDGDFDGRETLAVKAIAGPDIRSQYVRAQDGSVWRPNQRRLSFELREQ